MHFLVFGGSRNIGYFTTLRLLNQGHSATLLLRNDKVFDNDERMKPHVESGRAQLVKGDALVVDDVKRAWEKATDLGRTVDYVLFTLGATPDMSSFKLTKGFTINPPNITTKAILNVLCTIPESAARPKVIAATSTGVTKDSPIPLVYRPLYGYLLRGPHADKLGLERILAYATGRKWDDKEPREDITTVDGIKWQDRDGLPTTGSLETLVLRLPMLVEPKQKGAPPKAKASGASQPSDADNQADTKKEEEEKPKYRVGGPELSGLYTITRDEVGHFITEDAVKNWDQYKGKAITVSR